MRIIFLIIILLHAFIHILGFVKGFGFREIKELTIPMSKPMGLLWLIAAILLVIYGILYFRDEKYAWLVGFAAVTVSQVLIVIFWQDARFGTLPNIAVLLVSIIAYGHFSFQKLIDHETTELLSRSNNNKELILKVNDLEGLPKPVKQWLQHSGAIGKPHISKGKVTQKAEMKMKPEQKHWFKATAIQYSTIDVPAFIWSVNVKMNGLIGFRGRDKFEAGKGEMLIKLNSLIPVVNEQGAKLNEGTIQRYLGEMVWFPSLALSPFITWQEVNDSTAIATFDYRGTTGSGTFHFDSKGNFIRFSALRYMGNGPDATRHEWVLSVNGYNTFEGIKVPSKMTATWKLEDGDWTWLKLEILDIKYNQNINRQPV